MARIHTGRWPTRLSAALDWLVRDTTGQPFLDNLFAEFCERLKDEGVPLARAPCTCAPSQFMGARFLWRAGQEAELFFIEHRDARGAPLPPQPGLGALRGCRRHPPAARAARRDGDEYGIYADLRAEGLTDYVALPMQFTDGKRHATTWSTTGRAASPPPIWSRSTTRCRCWRWRRRSA